MFSLSNQSLLVVRTIVRLSFFYIYWTIYFRPRLKDDDVAMVIIWEYCHHMEICNLFFTRKRELRVSKNYYIKVLYYNNMFIKT